MKFNAKKFLLTGTALVAVSMFGAQAHAAALTPATGNTTVGAGDTWDIDGNTGAVDANLVYGAGAGDLTVTSGAGTDDTANIGGITLTDDAGTHGLTVGDGAQPVELIVNGNIAGNATTGANDLSVLINADEGTGAAGANAAMTFKGNVDLDTGAITLQDDPDGGTATANFAGTAAQSITGDIDGNSAGDGVINVTNTGGTVTFSGGIGQNTAVGALNIGGASGTSTVVFGDTVTTSAAGAQTGTITIGQTDGGSANVTFKNQVAAGGNIVMGEAAGATADTNTITFDATGGGYSVSGTIAGADVADTNAIVINTGELTKAVTLSNNVGAGGGIDTVTVNAASKLITDGSLQTSNGVTLLTGSVFEAHGAVTSTVAVGSGATYQIGATGATNGLTSSGNVTGAGTLTFAGSNAATTGQTVAGNVGTSGQSLAAVNVGNDNTGALTSTDTHTITGDLYATNVNFTASTSADATSVGGTLLLSGALNTNSTANVGTITSAVNGDGNLTLNPGNLKSVTLTVGNIGTDATHTIGNIVVGNNAATSGASTANLNGNVYANAITIGQSSGGINDLVTFNGTSAQTVTATIAGIAAKQGSVVVNNGANVTFNGTIGTGTAINGLHVTSGATATFTQNVSTDSNNAANNGFNGEGTVKIDATNNDVTVAEATGKVSLSGTTAVTGGAHNASITAANGVNIDGTLSTLLGAAPNVQTLTIGSGATATTIGGNADTTITAGNKIVLGNSGVTTFGADGKTATILINQNANFTPDDGTATPVITATAGTVNIGGTTGKLVIGVSSGSAALTDGQVIKVIDSSTAVTANSVASDYDTLITDGRVVLQDTGLVHLSKNAATTANDLVVTADFKDASKVFGNQVGAGAAESLMANTSATGNLATIRTNLLAAPNAAAAQEIAEAASPTADGSNVAGAFNATGEVFGVTQMRLAALEDGSAGMAAGDMMTGAHAWGQIFGQSANQDNRNGVDGYDAKTYGFALGSDVDAFDGRGHIGAALSYARTKANSDNANSTDTDIDSYQATLYGDVGIQNDMYLKGMVGYAFNDNDSTRHNVGGLAGVTASGDYNANQFSARAEIGRPFAMQQGFVLTPTVTADYAYYNAESYTETGAGTANLNVDQDSVSKFDLGVGLAASTRFQDNSGGTWKPGVSASYKYDLVGDDIQDTSSFTGGGAAFTTKGLEPARSQFAVGANVKYMTVNNWDFSAEYTYEFKSDYDAHDGILRAGYKF